MFVPETVLQSPKLFLVSRAFRNSVQYVRGPALQLKGFDQVCVFLLARPTVGLRLHRFLFLVRAQPGS